jgi:hypothetical protein
MAEMTRCAVSTVTPDLPVEGGRAASSGAIRRANRSAPRIAVRLRTNSWIYCSNLWHEKG